MDFSKPATASPSVYHDLNSLNKLKSANPQGEREALRAAVKEFEANGFRLKENIDNLPWQHCMVFVKE